MGVGGTATCSGLGCNRKGRDLKRGTEGGDAACTRFGLKDTPEALFSPNKERGGKVYKQYHCSGRRSAPPRKRLLPTGTFPFSPVCRRLDNSAPLWKTRIGDAAAGLLRGSFARPLQRSPFGGVRPTPGISPGAVDVCSLGGPFPSLLKVAGGSPPFARRGKLSA